MNEVKTEIKEREEKVGSVQGETGKGWRKERTKGGKDGGMEK